MDKPTEVARKPRADSQLSGLAGEFFAAAELLKREIQASAGKDIRVLISSCDVQKRAVIVRMVLGTV